MVVGRKGPIAYVEEDDKCVPLIDLLIPNDLYDEAIARYVGEKFRPFALPGRHVTVLAQDRNEMRGSLRQCRLNK